MPFMYPFNLQYIFNKSFLPCAANQLVNRNRVKVYIMRVIPVLFEKA